MLIALFRLLSLLPLSVLHSIGISLGWLVYLISPSYRHRLQKNSRQAGFATHTNRAVCEAGKSILELAFIWYASPNRVIKKIKIEHWEIAQKALEKQQGVIFLTPHLGCFEIIAQVIASRTALTALYRPPRKKALQPLIEGARRRANLQLAPANLKGVRSMLKALKNGQAIGLLPDQVPQQGEGVWADFFGRAAYTMTLPSKVHVMTGAPIILSYAERLSFGRGFIIRFFTLNDLIGQLPNDTPEQQAGAINLAMEKLIAYCPAQYMWSYNRYKIPAHIATVIANPIMANNISKKN